MVAKSTDIAAVTCEAVRGGMTEEKGVEEWTAVCRVEMAIKGAMISEKEEKKILVHFNRITFGTTPEPLTFSKDNRYIVFLNGIAGSGSDTPGIASMPIYRLLDRWLSIQPFELHLIREIQSNVEEENQVQQSVAGYPPQSVGSPDP